MSRGRLSVLVSATYALGAQLVRQLLILRNRLVLLLKRRNLQVQNYSTDQLAVIHGNAFRLIWDVRHCSHVKISGWGTFLPKGELVISADFHVKTFELIAFGRGTKVQRTITVSTLSVGLKDSFRSAYTGPRHLETSGTVMRSSELPPRFVPHNVRPQTDIPFPRLDNPIFQEKITHQLRKLTSYEA
jgi:hypothetical protein